MPALLSLLRQHRNLSSSFASSGLLLLGQGCQRALLDLGRTICNGDRSFFPIFPSRRCALVSRWSGSRTWGGTRALPSRALDPPLDDASSSKKHRTCTLAEISWSGLIALGFCLNGSTASSDDGSTTAPSDSGNGKVEGFSSNLQRVEDGSIPSNEHTVKWRIYTDHGRALFLKGKVGDAERFFNLALQEAKEGFGVRDAHVASSLNNLAEFHRLRREFGKAEPLYLTAIEILEESFGPDDIRVGAALHNLGQFYVMQHNLVEARACYEKALKIKRRVLGQDHTDYGDTMYHLGRVLHLLGKKEDSKALVEDSIKILEDAGLGETMTCIKRMKYLTHILLSLNLLKDLEILQRKILHVFELSKGWDSIDTMNAAESLALTLQSTGKLSESRELLERCLDSRKHIHGDNNIEIAANMLHLAKNHILCSLGLVKENKGDAASELSKARILLDRSLEITRLSLYHQKDIRTNAATNGSASSVKLHEKRNLLVLLFRSLDAAGLLEATRLGVLQNENCVPFDSRIALQESISIFKEPSLRNILEFPDVKADYLSCLKHLLNVVDQRMGIQKDMAGFQDMKDEVRKIEAYLASKKQ